MENAGIQIAKSIHNIQTSVLNARMNTNGTIYGKHALIETVWNFPMEAVNSASLDTICQARIQCVSKKVSKTAKINPHNHVIPALKIHLRL